LDDIWLNDLVNPFINTFIILEAITARQSQVRSFADRLVRIVSLHSLVVPFTIIEYWRSSQSVIFGLVFSILFTLVVRRVVEKNREGLDSIDPRRAAMYVWLICIVNFAIFTTVEQLWPRFRNYII